MASFFSRIFKWGQSEAHSTLDKIEDPVKMTEQGLRDLRKDLQSAMTSLAEVKAMAIRGRQDLNEKKRIASDYEKKAMILLTKAGEGQLPAEEGDRLASEALAKKESANKAAITLSQNLEKHEKMMMQLEGSVKKLRGQISAWETELQTLKARAKVSSATKKLNQQLAKVDSSSTISMLEKMRERVDQEEALAESYGELAQVETTVDDEINKAIAAGGSQAQASDSLLALKEKMAKMKKEG